MAGGNQKIGKYEIVSELGRGAMGVVYKGLDPVINRYVAIKTVIRQGGGAEAAELAERFKQEAQAAGRLNHPAVVGVYDYGEDGDQAYIVMEFVDGSTLSELSKYSGVFDVEGIIDLMVKVLDGLNFAHSKGIVHRDIKPSNIMRTADGEVKITDFGIARIESSELTQIGTVIGTPGYMSPEQLMGQRVDHRSDIFSCGILLYELLTGERAFASTNVTSTIYKVVHTELPPVSKICPTVPAAMDPALARALAKNPGDRYQSAQEFAQALEAVLRTAPVPAVAAPAPEDERTVIRALQFDDQGTVIATGNSRPDETGGISASQADAGAGTAEPLRESALREAPAPVPARNRRAPMKVPPAVHFRATAQPSQPQRRPAKPRCRPFRRGGCCR
ncbi:MAG: serine/threonine-protein kinase, partial [Gammaproteobacteria bacterium]